MSIDNPIKILFLAADPTDATRLRLGQELRDIRERLQLSKYHNKFILESRESARPGDISQAIFDVEPQIVHFSGHGKSTGELCFEDLIGKFQPIRPDALASLFELVSDQINCVVLNACYSEKQAKAIAEHIQFVVGMNQAIGDKAAIAFATGFYKAIGANRSIQEAFKFGRTEIQLQGILEHLTPVLHQKNNTNSQSTRVRYALVLSATIDEVDKPLAEAIVAHLRQLANDASITLQEIRTGSVILILDGSQDGFQELENLLQLGQLNEILSIHVQDIQLEDFKAELTATETSVLDRSTVETQDDYTTEIKESSSSGSITLATSLDVSKLYNHFLQLVAVESPRQIIARFRHLFIEGTNYPDPDIQLLLEQIVNSDANETEFLLALNRCCYILINRWMLSSSSQHFIPELVSLFESEPVISPNSSLTKNLQKLIKQFTVTEQYIALRRIAYLVNQNTESDSLAQPLGSLIRRYPYLYEHYLLPSDSNTLEQQLIKQFQVTTERQFEIDLSRYVTNKIIRPITLDNISSMPVKNPTLLSDSSLGFALNEFAGKVDGQHTKREIAQRFLSCVNDFRSYKDFKDNLYSYLVSSVPERYGRQKFYNLLWSQLESILPQNNAQLLNEFLFVRTCSKLLNFLVVEGTSQLNHFTFVDLVNNIGTTPTIGILLKIVLICRKVKPYLERRFSILFNHYELYSGANGVNWLIEALENLNVAFTTNFGTVNFAALIN